jgi:hypothetical protein
MTAAMDAGMTGATATPAELGAKFMRLGFGLFVFGLVIGYVPMAHYMHGSFETVGEAFLKNVTLWWGSAWTLAIYVTQVASLAMIVIGLCYVVAGFAGYYAVLAVWPNFYYGPVRQGIWVWLGLQAVCIANIAGVMYAYGGIKRALLVLTGRAPNALRAQR